MKQDFDEKNIEKRCIPLQPVASPRAITTSPTTNNGRCPLTLDQRRPQRNPFPIALHTPLCYPPLTNPARRQTPMLIRIGYDLVFDLPAPAPMLLMLSVRPEVFPS